MESDYVATPNYNLPTITGNMTADVVRDMNALAEATDDAIKGVDSRLTTHLDESKTDAHAIKNITGLQTTLNNKPTKQHVNLMINTNFANVNLDEFVNNFEKALFVITGSNGGAQQATLVAIYARHHQKRFVELFWSVSGAGSYVYNDGNLNINSNGQSDWAETRIDILHLTK